MDSSGGKSTPGSKRDRSTKAKTSKRSRKPTKPFSSFADIVYGNANGSSSGSGSGNAHSTGVPSTAGKCCSQCGATKTPQWREGPLGPKTLCNACGVKRVRAARAACEARQGRGASSAATKKGGVKKKEHHEATVTAPTRKRTAHPRSSAARATAFILEALEEREKEEEEQKHPGSGRQGVTATTPASNSSRQSSGDVKPNNIAGRRSGNPSLHLHPPGSEESGEEIAFYPPRPPMSPIISAMMGEGGVAALGLIQMRGIHMSLDQIGLINQPGGSASPGPQMHDRAGEAKGNNGATSPAALSIEQLQDQAAEAARHALVAEAAVAAVAQVLSLKQAIAMKARAEAETLRQRVSQFTTASPTATAKK
eukprot:CAMPEP_0198246926 /NCGR_PEP_ID=MMETSP1446-20131203/46221_1 /TAXON_ID=1461542 ORGANISM="Unidentified sp, Strain CCMP2111" /NCGR_SAMPLE_ID=MMETSP1446 /ASSEMBLY_ACC=CAM_ASM_001112 /LENGTH=366 /DNA_ID=CAMNT_0043931251 /DNA_START=805 /DNA_END=1905 /DNA_ORIENTATION=-